VYSDTEDRETRKIQFTGRSTYILSLPKKWVEEMHLKAGDQVMLVREMDNSLAIISESKRRSTSITEATAIVTPKETGETLKRKVVAMYLAGYNTIHLKLKMGKISPLQRDAVRDLVRRNLVGTEMVADSSDIITLQVLLSLPELSVYTAIRRMYLIASSMHRDAMSAMSELNEELAKEVIKSDDEVDRFSLYISRNLVMASQNGRILREIGLKKPSDCLSFRSAVKSIERIADHASAMAERSTKFQEKIPREIFEKIEKMSALSLTVLADSVEALLRRDYHLADRTVDNVQNIYALENDVLASTEKQKIRDAASVKLVLEDIRRTAEYASDIAEAAINETIDEIVEKYSSGHIERSAQA